MRVGILGGVFNPPHIGHLVCAQEALVQLGLETVVLVPVGQAPHRRLEDDPGAEVRLELADRATAGDARLAVSRVEVDRPGPSYTADTLRLMRERAPGDELVLVLGGDQAAALPSWHDPEAVLQFATVAAAERTGWPRERIAAALSGLEGAGAVEYFDMPRIDVSSSLVRRRVAVGLPIRYLVPDPVADAIADKRLYVASTPAAAT